MDVLNKDCLQHIFLNLDFIDRVKLENVCKAWYSVLQLQSTFSDTKQLDISKFLTTSSTEYYPQESLNFVPTVLGVIERCGKYVREITFGQRWLKISQPVIDCIAVNCPRLRVIDFGATILNADLEPLLENVADHLEELSLEETSWVDIENGRKIQLFFKRMKKLKKLNLRSAMFMLDRIDEIPPQLEELSISGAHRIPPETFENFLEKQKHLRILDLSPIPALSEGVLDSIGNLPSLQKFNIGFSDQILFDYDPLMRLTHLTELRLVSIAGLTETCLHLVLSCLPQLQALSIKKCTNIREYTALGFCKQLTELEIADTISLSDEDHYRLCTYGKLKQLTFINCFNISTRGVNSALTRCQLESITINRCSLVTDEMMYMLASTQREIKNVSLQGCSGITSKGVSALAWLRNVLELREIDVSRNKNVNDAVVLNLHNALTMAYRRKEGHINGAFDEDSICQQEDRRKLLMYISETSISHEVQKEVEDLLILS
ncbi:unnamed protein product [Auanema sp. JU1783]|nr:unnamed protein product [Auanema sp. JU1783]